MGGGGGGWGGQQEEEARRRRRGWRWFAQTACGLQGGREAEIILRSQAFSPLSISQRGPLCIILGARLARISAAAETKVISLAFRTTDRCPETTNLLFYHHIISPCREKMSHRQTLIFQRFIMYIYSILKYITI